MFLRGCSEGPPASGAVARHNNSCAAVDHLSDLERKRGFVGKHDADGSSQLDDSSRRDSRSRAAIRHFQQDDERCCPKGKLINCICAGLGSSWVKEERRQDMEQDGMSSEAKSIRRFPSAEQPPHYTQHLPRVLICHLVETRKGKAETATASTARTFLDEY